jgi:plastocyanin
VRAAAALVVLLGVAAARGAPTAPTGSVRGQVKVTAGGKERRDAQVVVYVTGFDEPPPDAVPEIRQHGKQFLPSLLAITAGQTVAFPNGDPFFHNVFSLSPARRFDLGQFKQGEKESKEFPRPGVVQLYCNIHPEMAATILVLPNRRWARADADGTFRIPDLPPGKWTIYAYSRRAAEPVSAPLEVVAGETTKVSLALEETKSDFAHANKFGEKYRDPEKYKQ